MQQQLRFVRYLSYVAAQFPLKYMNVYCVVTESLRLSQTVFQLDRKAVLLHGKKLAACGQLPRRSKSTHLSRKHCPNSMKDDPVYCVGMTANAKKQQHKVVSERVRVPTRNMHRDLDKL